MEKRIRFDAEQPPAPPIDGATPMMAQFLELKARHPDALLFYRMGDFYELFFDDAVQASAALDIALTKRGKHGGDDIPMCGVPVERAEGYLHRLVEKGFRVAVAEQTEDPAEAKKRPGKPLVARDVIRLVTPGTLTEDTLLESRAPSLLAAIGWAERGAALALAWADVAEGVFWCAAVDRVRLDAEIARLAPKEVILPDALDADPKVREALQAMARPPAVTPLPAARFDRRSGERRLAAAYGVATLEGFGAFTAAEVSALGALHDYVETTQAGADPRLSPPQRQSSADHLGMDPATRASLEIVETLSGRRQGSLLGAIDRCVTPAGSRLLRARLTAPSADPTEILRRQDAVAYLRDDDGLRRRIREGLKAAPDLARPLTRLGLGRGGPRDLASLAQAIHAADALLTPLRADDAPPALIRQAQKALADAVEGPPGRLAEEIRAGLVDEPPIHARDGAFIRHGVDPELDRQRALNRDADAAMAALGESYASKTGARGLKIKNNAVLGWFVETPVSQEELLLDARHGGLFTRRQSMANAVRFKTEELTVLEAEILRAAERALAIEKARFEAWRTDVIAEEARLRAAAEALATLDVAAMSADLSEDRNWTRPEIVEDPAWAIDAGRHPVVEDALAAEGAPFTPNDCDLDAEDGPALLIVTGPNMAGKSTYLRQNALILIMAQAGLDVPAATARIGVADRLFSRVGAADDLARGRSTFMAEMLETAAILRQAGPKSFVILDEVGRGTATFDGLAIAWACLEHLHDVNQCRALFATHYHEATALEGRLARAKNVSLRAKEWKGDLVFLHEVGPGPADKSYGVQAARLAGMPDVAVARAAEVLEALESQQDRPAERLEALPLFAAAAARPATPAQSESDHPVLVNLRALDVDGLSPREALEALYELKSLGER